jgi:hypothetical protein
MPEIISKEDFNKAKYLLSSSNAKSKAVEDYLCSGLLYCSCGGKMHGNRRYCGRDKLLLVTYRCANRSQQRNCDTKEINKVYLDGYVMDIIYKYIFDSKTVGDISQRLKDYRNYMTAKNKAEIEICNTKLAEISNNIDNLITLAMKNQIVSDSIKEKLSSFESEKLELELQIQSLKHNLLLEDCNVPSNKEIADTKNYFKCHYTNKTKYLVGEYIDKIIVDNDTVKIHFKINLPDENMTLKPLVVSIKRDDIYKRYKPVI